MVVYPTIGRFPICQSVYLLACVRTALQSILLALVLCETCEEQWKSESPVVRVRQLSSNKATLCLLVSAQPVNKCLFNLVSARFLLLGFSLASPRFQVAPHIAPKMV